MPTVSPLELVVVLVVVLLLFGTTRLPKLARSIGQASQEFKKGVRDGRRSEPDDAASSADDPNEKVTMTRAELDAMLAERDARARRDGTTSGT